MAWSQQVFFFPPGEWIFKDMNSGSATGRGRRGASSLVVVLCAAALLSSSPAASFTVHLHSTLPSACSRTQIAASGSFLRSLVVPECKGTGASFLRYACGRTSTGGLVPRAGGEPDSKRSPAEFNRDPGESEIKTFLTQRALQNLVFILATLGRDEITADWLEAWQGHEGIRHYHGTSGLHIGGRAFITKLMRTPNEEVVVEFKRRGNGEHLICANFKNINVFAPLTADTSTRRHDRPPHLAM